MKRNFWRKTAAFTLALTLATGSLPANAPLQDLFSGAVMTAYAEVTASGYCGASTNEGGAESVVWSLEDGVLTIDGEGAITDYYDVPPWYSSRSDITEAVIKSGVTSVGNRAFINCSNLISVVIPDGVTSIGSTSFYGCKSLTSITIPDSVTSIGDAAFSQCRAFTSITIPDSVTNIGVSALESCNSLTSVIMESETPPVIGDDIFLNTPNDLKIRVPANAVDNYQTDEKWSAYKEHIVSMNTVVHGYCGASTNEGGETSVSWTLNTDGVLTISGTGEMENYAYNGAVPWYDYNQDITEAVIEDGVTSIGVYAFYSCTNLTSVTIPDSVTSIGEYAFVGCNALKAVIVERAETLTALGSNAFVYYDYEAGDTAILPNVTIYVPATKAEEYKNAENWSDYADRIIGYSDMQLPDGKYKQTAQKDGTYYTRFVFVVPKTDFAGKSKALFTATYNGTDYTYETSTYYTGVISNGVTFTPASAEDRAMFVVTVTSGSDISADLTCKLDFE